VAPRGSGASTDLQEIGSALSAIGVPSKAVRNDPNNPRYIIQVPAELNELRYRVSIDKRASWIAEWGAAVHLSRERRIGLLIGV
jgi:hypothetical protein